MNAETAKTKPTTKTVRVLLVLESLTMGGSEQSFLEVVRLLKGEVQFDIFFANSVDTPAAKLFEAEGCNIFRTHTNRWNFPANARHLTDYLAQVEPYDIIQGTSYRCCYLFKHLQKAARSGKLGSAKLPPRRVLQSHMAFNPKFLPVWYRLFSIIGKLLYAFNKSALTDRIAVSTPAGRSLFGSDSFEVLPNPVDFARFTPQLHLKPEACLKNLQGKQIVLGTTGRLSVQKNPLFLVALLSHFLETHPETDWNLRFVGSGNLEPKIWKLADKLQVRDRITITGAVPASEIPTELAKMDIFCFPSLFEGFGLSLIEAEAAGLKCIASTEVPEEACLISAPSTVKFLPARLSLPKAPLREDVEAWGSAILELLSRPNSPAKQHQQVLNSIYSAPNARKLWCGFYS